MKIIKSYPEEMSFEVMYKLTLDDDVSRMREAVGTTLDIEAYVIREDMRNDNKTKIIALMASNGAYATNSNTFISDFEAIVELCEKTGRTLRTISVEEGQSAKGRSFLKCKFIK